MTRTVTLIGGPAGGRAVRVPLGSRQMVITTRASYVFRNELEMRHVYRQHGAESDVMYHSHSALPASHAINLLREPSDYQT